jgi:hypothetical protein
MTTTPKDTRDAAEAKFSKAQKTSDEVKGIVDTELQATRKKTARLRQERLAKEAAEGVSELDKKSGKKPTARSRK